MRAPGSSIVALALLIAANSAAAATVERNWARGKTTRQSSVAFDGQPARAVDGDRNGEFPAASVTHTTDEIDPYWEVDLGAAYPIDEVRIFGRTDCCRERLKNFVVFSVNNLTGFRFRSVADTLTQQEANDATAVQFVPVLLPAGILVDPVTGRRAPGQIVTLKGAWVRYVRIQITGQGILSLAEVEVVQKTTIDGPAGLADATTWRSTGHQIQSAAAFVSTANQLLLLSTTADGRLVVSEDFGRDQALRGSPAIGGDAPAAGFAGATSQLHIAARERPPRGRPRPSTLWVADADVKPAGVGTPRWQQLDATDESPALVVACDKVVVAWRHNGGVYSRWRPADAGGVWSPAQTHGATRSRPTLAVTAAGRVAVAFVDGTGAVALQQSSCADAALSWTANAPAGRIAAGDQVSLAAWGPLFIAAILGDDQQAYFAIQNANRAGWSPYEAIGASPAGRPLAETPRLAVFSGAIIALTRSDDNSTRYWVRSPSTIVARDGWIGGTLVGQSGVTGLPVTTASVGQSPIWGIFHAPSELFGLTRNPQDGGVQIINLGRVVAADVLTHIFRLSVGAQHDIAPQPDRGLDVTLVLNLFEEMMAVLALPRDAWPAVASTHCNGLDRATELILDPAAAGTTTPDACPARTLQDASPSGSVDGLMHEWMHIDFAERHISSGAGFSSAFRFDPASADPSASGLRACKTDQDCGGDLCEQAGDTHGGNAAGTIDFSDTDTSSRRWDQTLVCVSRRDGPKGRRYQGGVWWYDLGTDDHAFIDTATLYRWYGDDLRDMAAADTAAGNTQLSTRYNWLRDHYFAGVEYTGRLPAVNTDRNAGAQGFPNK